MWLIKTILISSFLGISLGTTSGLLWRYFAPVQTNIPQVQAPKIILASSNDDCCNQSEEDIPTVGQEIIAAQIVNGEEQKVLPTPTPEPQVEEIVFASKVPEEIKSEATPSAVPTEVPMSLASEDSTEPQTPQGLNATVLTDMINKYRQKLGLETFSTDENLCSLAQTRAVELSAEFLNGRLHSGLFNRNLPYWITENAILMRTEEQAFNWWLNSPVHRGQIQGSFKFGCLACSGFQCAQVFTNYISKN